MLLIFILISVDYANGSLFVVNGPDNQVEVRGYTFNLGSGEVTSKFGKFVDPHDLAVTSDGKEVSCSNKLLDKILKKISQTFLKLAILLLISHFSTLDLRRWLVAWCRWTPDSQAASKWAKTNKNFRFESKNHSFVVSL